MTTLNTITVIGRVTHAFVFPPECRGTITMLDLEIETRHPGGFDFVACRAYAEVAEANTDISVGDLVCVIGRMTMFEFGRKSTWPVSVERLVRIADSGAEAEAIR